LSPLLQPRFPPVEIATKIGLSLALGLLVGLEREWSHKDLGVRTFTITALLGMLSTLSGIPFSLASMLGILLVIAFVNGRSLLTNGSLETTTSVALIVTFVLGVLIGQGHFFTPVASAIILTMLLAWKAELRRFAGGLTTGEVRSAVLLGLIAFVVYPLLPDRFVDPWQLLNPRDTWMTVVLVAGIGFINYLLLRLYSAKGLYYSAILGGFVNSTATIAEMTQFLSRTNPSMQRMTIPVVLLTVIAMTIRNLVILGALAPNAVSVAIGPLTGMIFIAVAFAWSQRRTAVDSDADLKISSPISLINVLGFGFAFVAIHAAGILGQQYFGRLGIYIVSAFGGFVSSATTTAAAASMTTHDRLTVSVAANATVIATLASILINIPILYRYTERDIRNQLYLVKAFLLAATLGILALQNWLLS